MSGVRIVTLHLALTLNLVDNIQFSEVIMKPFIKLAHIAHRALWRLMKPITVGVRVILVNEGKVLLVEHSYSSGWYLPGGGVKKFETLEEAIRRELAEEAGATLGILRLVGVYTNLLEHKSDHIIVFACEDFTLNGMKDREIKSLGFFKIHELPQGTSPGTRRRITEYLNEINKTRVGIW